MQTAAAGGPQSESMLTFLLEEKIKVSRHLLPLLLSLHFSDSIPVLYQTPILSNSLKGDLVSAPTTVTALCQHQGKLTEPADR